MEFQLFLTLIIAFLESIFLQIWNQSGMLRIFMSRNCTTATTLQLLRKEAGTACPVLFTQRFFEWLSENIILLLYVFSLIKCFVCQTLIDHFWGSVFTQLHLYWEYNVLWIVLTCITYTCFTWLFFCWRKGGLAAMSLFPAEESCHMRNTQKTKRKGGGVKKGLFVNFLWSMTLQFFFFSLLKLFVTTL